METIADSASTRLIASALTTPLANTSVGAWFARPLTALLGLDELQRVYDGIPTPVSDQDTFFERTLRALGVSIEVSEVDLGKLPASGATIVVANHPFGGLDGLVAGAVVARRRRDMRMLANTWLGRVPELSPWLIDVNVFDERRATTSNATALRAVLDHLHHGGVLVVFPAGMVSHWRADAARIEDPPWSRAVASLARRTAATIVPLYFPGRNGVVFHVGGLVHSGLRTALLPRELLARRARAVGLRIGTPVSNRLVSSLDDSTLTAWMRVRTEALRDSVGVRKCSELPVPASLSRPGNFALLLSEWLRLGDSSLLAEAGKYCVLRAGGWQIPQTLDEIGRLRELAFRAVGEGKGAERDLDRFDLHYDHVFVVDRDACTVVGAYRVGFCDRILRDHGPKGLYTNSLFVLKRPILEQIQSALELGRAFVRPEYQRQALPLAMLWRGIGELLLREPRYDALVGAASISASTGPAVHRLGAALLRRTAGSTSLSRFVQARHPLKTALSTAERELVAGFRGGVRDIKSMLAELDPNGNGLPMLIRRYLELGGQVLDLSVDPSFGGCLDAFVRVEVPSAPRAMLDRFMTAQGAASYLLWHGRPCHKDDANPQSRSQSKSRSDASAIADQLPPAFPPPPEGDAREGSRRSHRARGHHGSGPRKNAGSMGTAQD